MAEDAAGAVRRTPNPPRGGDHQTLETGASVAPGATNPATPVSLDAGNATGDLRVFEVTLTEDIPVTGGRILSGPWTDPVGTVREHDDGSTAVKVAMGNDTGKGQHVWCEMTPDLAVRWLAHDEVAEWATEREARLAALRALVAADPGALFQVGHVHDTSNDMQAFLELPDCEACEGTGKDQHGSPFEAPLAVHFAGPPCEVAGRRRQLCMWCGHVLLDVQLVDGEITPHWLEGALIRIEDGIGRLEPYEYGGELPPGCCALPDDEDQAPAEPPVAPAPSPWLRCPNTPPCEHPSPIHDVSGDPEDPKPMCCADGCRCGQPDDGPNQAQETRAAADWPPENIDTHADEVHRA